MIAFSSDVIKDAAEELGLPEKQVEHHLNFIIHWIKKLVKRTDITTIQLPHLGSIFIKWALLRRKHDRLLSIPKERREIWWAKMNKEGEERLGNLEKIYENREGYIKQKKKGKLTNKYFTTGKTREELEIWQNQD